MATNYDPVKRLKINEEQLGTRWQEQGDGVEGSYVDDGSRFHIVNDLGDFQSKYNVALKQPDGSFKVTFQNPGMHKYDTLEATYVLDPATGEYVMQGEPVQTRQTSSADRIEDGFVKGIGFVGTGLAAGYGLGTALGAYGAGGVGTMGTIPASTATASGSLATTGMAVAPELATIAAMPTATVGGGGLGTLGTIAAGSAPVAALAPSGAAAAPALASIAPMPTATVASAAGAAGGAGSTFGDLTWKDAASVAAKVVPAAIGAAGAADAQREAEQETAVARTEAQTAADRDLLNSRPNQSTPWGNVSWTNDPVTGRPIQTTTLPADAQAAIDAERSVLRNQKETAAGLNDRVAAAYSTAFDPKRYESYLAGVNPVNQESLGRAGTFTANAPELNTEQLSFTKNPNTIGLNQSQLSTAGYASGAKDLLQDFNPYANGVNQVNQNAPQFSNERVNEYAKAAYESQMGLMRDDLRINEERIRNSLALQGLTPGTQASNNALSSFENARANQFNSLTNSSLLTGNQMANTDYASMLAGFNAGNAAQGQAFDQQTGIFKNTNEARNQQLANSLARFNADLNGQTVANSARDAAFKQDLLSQQFNLDALNSANTAKDKTYQQQLSAYGANLTGLNTNANMLRTENDAQSQAFDQAAKRYTTNFGEDAYLRNLPLAEQNALNGGALPQPSFGQVAGTNGSQYANNVANVAGVNAQQNANNTSQLYADLLSAGLQAVGGWGSTGKTNDSGWGSTGGKP